MKEQKQTQESWKRETIHSMKRRAVWHDYRAQGTYMLTLTVEGRRALLGRLVTDCDGPTDNHNGTANTLRAHVALSPLGEAVLHDAIMKIPCFYPQVEVWRVCMMPDHVHMILRVCAPLPEGKTLGTVINGLKIGCNRAYRRIILGHNTAENGKQPEKAQPNSKTQAGNNAPTDSTALPASSSHTPSSIAHQPHTIERPDPERPVPDYLVPEHPVPNHLVPERPVPERNMLGQISTLFEPGYNDRLLSDGDHLKRWKHYLDDNPRRLALKRQHPDLFTVMHGRNIGNWQCQMVGNIFLMDIPDKVAVIVHRADSEETYTQKKAEWLACGERGGVIVSAAIAQREKMVMREAMERGYRLILLRENGFPKLHKPSGEAFDACASGQLLQISPWSFHMQSRKISREQCLELNRLAEAIAEGATII